jgi:drug/metabolite transporter (DMT)-like permease
MSEGMSTLRGGPSPRLGERRLRRSAELALIAIAAVWGLTFVMVQDAIALLPTMAFLAYRFIPASLIVALVFWRPLRRLPAAGWRAGLEIGRASCRERGSCIV